MRSNRCSDRFGSSSSVQKRVVSIQFIPVFEVASAQKRSSIIESPKVQDHSS
jgi:hypothetical protein